MSYTKHKRTKKNTTKRSKKCKPMFGGKNKSKSKSGKKWTTAVEAATNTFKKTGSVNAARATLRKQALSNARKLFGSI